MTAITLLDGSLKLSVFYEEADYEFADNIVLRFAEDCPEEEKLFKADETNIYLTAEQTALIILELGRALGDLRGDPRTGGDQ